MNTFSRRMPDTSRSEGDVTITDRSDDLVFPPGGPRRRSRMRRARPGERVRFPADEGELGLRSLRLKQRDAPGPPDLANWITYAEWQNTTGGPITQFVSTWTVPPAPANRSSQLIYLFNGMQTADGQIIVQPVLQWGDHGTGNDGVNRTGPFWTVASWLVGGPSATHSRHVPVNAGDILVGAITLADQSENGFSYSCQFEGISETQLAVDPMAELVCCVETLEAYEPLAAQTVPYDLNDAQEYPAGSVTFSKISITTNGAGPPAQWSSDDLVSVHRETTSISTNSTAGGEIVIIF